jgi:hypothetical protein
MPIACPKIGAQLHRARKGGQRSGMLRALTGSGAYFQGRFRLFLRPFLSGKKRIKRKSTNKKGAGAQARPCFLYPLRFLFFGSFFSFSERKERTECLPFFSFWKEKDQKKVNE